MTIRFEGRAEFQARIVQTLQWAGQTPCTTLHAWDPSFVEWPWSDAAVLAALTAWARPGRCLSLLAMDFEELARRQPRFVRWRRDFGHVVTARLVDAEQRPESGPQALLVAGDSMQSHCLTVFERRSWRGKFSEDASERLRALEWFDALTQRSSESFASTTLGL